jgi:hypothetical protein
MATESFTKQARRALYAFANKVASRVSDSRRRRFVREMVTGIVIANHVHLTRIARAVGKGDNKVHAHEKRLSRNLDSPHWNMQPMVDGLMQQSATMVDDDSLIVADLTDVSKYYARKMEGLGKVRDASDPDKRFAPGYMLFEAYVRVRRWQLFPLVIEPLKTYAGAPTSENEEILGHLLRIHRQTGGRGTWVMDRGADRQELMVPLMRHRVAFVIRQRGDRLVTTPGGRTLLMQELAGELFVKAETWPWPRKGLVVCCPVRLPQAPQHELLLVAYWRTAGSAPLLLLVSPAARAAGRNGFWFVRAYFRRWGVEDATRGIKQRFHLEQFLVRSWRSIRRLICLVAISFFWLNLWGEPRFDSLRNALLGHPWRIPKEVTFLFNWIASQIREILHPRPKLTIDTG